VSVIEARGLSKRYMGGDGGVIAVLEDVDLAVERGEMVAIIGASGAGKSTLLHLLGALDRPSAGDVIITGRALSGLDDDAVSALRNRTVGFVFQFHHLLREFTALENVMMPLRIAGVDDAQARRRALGLLDRVGLSGRANHRPAQLSGGEQQRTAVARALAADPSVLLADEPSGNGEALLAGAQVGHRDGAECRVPVRDERAVRERELARRTVERGAGGGARSSGEEQRRGGEDEQQTRHAWNTQHGPPEVHASYGPHEERPS